MNIPSNLMLEINRTDKELIQSFQQTQSNKTFEFIYDRYAPFVYRKCLLMTGSESDAQDLTQEIWIKVYFGLDKFRFESKFSTWLSRITINRCINYLKNRGKLIFSEDIEEMKNGSLPKINFCLDVTKLLSRLSITTKVLFTLKYIEGLSYEEIAEATGTGVSAIKMRIARAKKDLIKYSQGIDTKKLQQMMTSEDEMIKKLLESQYADAVPPQRLKADIMGTIELIKTLKELALLYTKVPLDLLSQ